MWARVLQTHHGRGLHQRLVLWVSTGREPIGVHRTVSDVSSPLLFSAFHRNRFRCERVEETPLQIRVVSRDSRPLLYSSEYGSTKSPPYVEIVDLFQVIIFFQHFAKSSSLGNYVSERHGQNLRWNDLCPSIRQHKGRIHHASEDCEQVC